MEINKNKVIEMSANGKNAIEISKITGYPRKTVASILRTVGVTRPGCRPSSPEEEQLIAEKYLAGSSTKDIALELNRSQAFIRTVLDRRNIRKIVPKSCNQWADISKIITHKIIKFKPPYLCTVKDKRTGKVTNYYDVSELYIDKGYQELPEWKIALEKKGIVNFGYGYYHPERAKEVSLAKWTR